MDMRENAVKLVERVVRDDELAPAAFAAAVDRHLRTQGFGKSILELPNVRILPGSSSGCPGFSQVAIIFFRRIDQSANQ